MRNSISFLSPNSDSLVGGQQFAPLEAALHRQHVALGITLRARRAADLVGRFQRQQVLVAGDHIQGRQRFRDMRVQRFQP
jgi:hypothetical protein